MANKRKELNARLGDYTAGARLATAATTLRGRLGNWPVYAAAVGSALAMSTNASADIINGQISGAVVSPAGSRHTFVEGVLLLGEINIKASSGNSFAALLVSGVAPKAFIFDTTANGSQAVNFALGSPIGGGTGKVTPNVLIANSTFNGARVGQFLSGVPGYAGLAFKVAGGYDYGWLELEFFNNLNGAPTTLEALGFGVDTTPNEAILAGTPEPGTMGLALLATGAYGVAALRRRRKQQQAEPAA
jgi:hypothetical protein